MSNDKSEATGFVGFGNETPQPATVKPTKKPSTKVVSGAAAGAVVVVVVWVCSLFGLEVPGDVASALTVLVGFGAGYVVPDPRRVP